MNIDVPGSYAKFYKNERKTASYLGYTDVAEYRKFRFIAPVLDSYTVLHIWCQQRKAKVPLQLLRDLRDPEAVFGADHATLIQMYPVAAENGDRAARIQSNLNRDYIYAGVLYHLNAAIEVTSTMDSKELASLQVTSSKKFEKEVMSKGFRIPNFDVATVQYPVLGPLAEFGEDKLERYSRVNALLKSLQCALAPTKWKEAFVTSKNGPFQSIQIGINAHPTWMQPATPTNALGEGVLTQTKRPSLPKKAFWMNLDRHLKSEFAEELDRHIEDHFTRKSLRLPELELKPNRDPRAYPIGELWRDTLRQQLNFVNLRVDFLAIDVVGEAEPESPIPAKKLLIYDFCNLSSAKSWTDVSELLNDPKLYSFHFVYTLRVVEMEDDEYEFEYDGPPLAIINDIELTEDYDVTERRPTTSDDQVISEAAAQQAELEERIEKFLG